jgi:hypothetical protein
LGPAISLFDYSLTSTNPDAGCHRLPAEQSLVAESDEDKPGVVRDFDKEGNLVSLEVLAVALRDVLDLEQQPLLFRGIC